MAQKVYKIFFITMKNAILIMIALVSFENAWAQKKKTEPLKSDFQSEQWLKNGNFLVNVGIGLGSPYYPSYYGTLIPPFSLSADYLISIPNDPLKGKLGIGGLIGFGSARYRSAFFNPSGNVRYNYTWTYTYFLVGARANYHILMAKKVDLYLGIMAALRFGTHRFSSDFDGFNRAWATTPHTGWFLPGVYIGCRYFFTNNIAVFGELGYNVSWLTGGISFKF